jgi:hypothetical protein
MSFQQWLQHGEVVYQNAVQEYQALQTQMEELERRLTSKQAELNQISSILNKPPVEPARRSPSQSTTAPISFSNDNGGIPGGIDSIARAPVGRTARVPLANG